MYTCSICNKSFKSPRALQGHMSIHGPSQGKKFNIMCCCLLTRKEMMVTNLDKFQKRYLDYVNNPNICIECGQPIPFDTKNNKFCSQSCSASYTNKQRTKTTKGKTKTLICTVCGEEYEGSIHTSKNKGTCQKCNPPKKQKTKEPLYCIGCGKKLSRKTKSGLCVDCVPKKQKQVIFGEFSKLPWRKCAHCGSSFITRKIVKYCSECDHLYSTPYRVKYKFTFNIYDYPDLFDLERLSEVGFFAPRGKSGKWNPNGLSRDHRVSVNEAIKYGYDPYYISHPMNCELMPHIENNKKKTRSSITYQELVDSVIQYDLKAGGDRIELSSFG